jgi:hypothetical protein
MDLRYAATRVGMWFIMESKRMAKQGKTAQEIIARLNDFRHVLKDWRDRPVPLPSDEFPEFWDRQALEEFIVKRKPEWLKDPDTADTFQGL